MGAALEATGRDIVYSCSWPAYIGDNETEKPFDTFIMDGCNLWRNWDDIQCDWGSLGSIIDHWGDWGSVLAPWAGPGHWHDPDMLLIGNGCITADEERTQMAIWSIVAAPLIMGNDMRNVSDVSKQILFNADAIAVNQDPLGQMGLRLDNSSSAPQQRWYRLLANGDVAVALYNKQSNAPQPPIPGPPCNVWNHTFDGYYEACGGAAGNVGQFGGLTRAQAQAACCDNPQCAGFSFGPDANNVTGGGFYKGNAMCGFTHSSGYEGYDKAGQIPAPGGNPADIKLNFADIDLFGPINVYDIWAQQSLGTFTDSFTAKQVPFHGTAFYRLSKA
jgi:Alpha galactosidase A/Alpha galactosidase C-terminal beta sandwich domain